MEQNFKNQQELQQQGYIQTSVEIETQDEAEMRYQRFLLEETNRQALLPKKLQSSSLRPTGRRQESEQKESSEKCDMYCGRIFTSAVISAFIFGGVFAIYKICQSVS